MTNFFQKQWDNNIHDKTTIIYKNIVVTNLESTHDKTIIIKQLIYN